MSTLRSMTNNDLLAYKRLCTICYSYTDTNPVTELPEEALRIRRGVFDEEGKLLSAMMEIPYDVRFGNETVKMAGIGGVVTDPTARAGGNIRRIFENDLPQLYQDGYVFSALYPFSFRFYGKFGYTWAEFWRSAEIPRTSLRADLRRADAIVRVLPEDDAPEIRAIYEQFVADKSLAILRNDQMWNDLRRGTPWDSLKHTYVLHIDDSPAAYWIGKVDKQGHSATLHIQDMAWTSHAGLEAIFAMLRGMNELETISVRVQSGFEPRMLVDEAYDVEEKGATNAMVRVINVERALALLNAPVLPGTLTVEVQDEQIPNNCGKFTVTCDGYTLSVARDDRANADMRCDIRGLSALIAGRHRFEDAMDLGLVDMRMPKKTRLASMLFAERKLHLNWNF